MNSNELGSLCHWDWRSTKLLIWKRKDCGSDNLTLPYARRHMFLCITAAKNGVWDCSRQIQAFPIKMCLIGDWGKVTLRNLQLQPREASMKSAREMRVIMRTIRWCEAKACGPHGGNRKTQGNDTLGITLSEARAEQEASKRRESLTFGQISGTHRITCAHIICDSAGSGRLSVPGKMHPIRRASKLTPNWCYWKTNCKIMSRWTCVIFDIRVIRWAL